MNLKELKELIEAVNRSAITQFEMEQEGLKLSLRKDTALQTVGAPNSALAMTAYNQLPAAQQSVPVTALTVPEEEGILLVKSPMVGVFYEAPQPGAPPFVKIGDQIRLGQILCIIEAMKLMNEVQAEIEGTIVDIMIRNEEMAEYGQPLFKVKSK